MKEKNKFSELIEVLISDYFLTDLDIATAFEVEQSTVSKWRSGVTPRLGTRSRISVCLGVEVCIIDLLLSTPKDVGIIDIHTFIEEYHILESMQVTPKPVDNNSGEDVVCKSECIATSVPSIESADVSSSAVHETIVDEDPETWSLSYREVALIAVGVLTVMGAVYRGELEYLVCGNPLVMMLSVILGFVSVYYIQTKIIDKVVNTTAGRHLTDWFSSGPIMIGGGNGKK